MTKGRPNPACIVKVGEGRGFVIEHDADMANLRQLQKKERLPKHVSIRLVVTAAHCLRNCLSRMHGVMLIVSTRICWELWTQEIQPFGPSASSLTPLRIRDRLCVLIRQYNLDPTLVKAYAADFCGTPTLKDASRELVESFISHLATSAKENRDGLVCKLNSYAQPVEVKP